MFIRDKFLINSRWASKEEPYWWLMDNHEIKHRLYFSFFKATSDKYKDCNPIYTLVIGRWKITYGKI